MTKFLRLFELVQVQLNRMEIYHRLFSGFIYLVCTFGIIPTFASTSVTTQKEYNYTFKVLPVDRCPMNESDWKAAAEITGCNDTHVYHCVPDKFHSSLIEFCYYKKPNLVQEGNCLELAAKGILHQVKCDNFSRGCPEQPYLSDEIYRYPVCLSVEFDCFTSDAKCLYQRLKEQRTLLRHVNATAVPTDNKQQIPTDCTQGPLRIAFIISLILLVLVLVAGIVLYRISRKKDSNHSELDTQDFEIPTASTSFLCTEERQNLLEESPDYTDYRACEVAIPSDLQTLPELESELIFEDIYLSLLMRRHCRKGAFKNFNYLLKTRILDKDDKNINRILTSRDKNGYTLLHCAAEGGSTKIFEALMTAIKEKQVMKAKYFNKYVGVTTHCGETVLHLACKYSRYNMCSYLLSRNEYKKRILTQKTSNDWSSAHFTAMGGSKLIMDLLESKNLDITSKTKNGLNVLDIACIHGHVKLCAHLLRQEKVRKHLLKFDEHGWTIFHFAAMVGNNEIYDSLISVKKVKTSRGQTIANVIERKTNREKTILHICCEYGNYHLCQKILKSHRTLLHDVDEEQWNALHYAAKGGNKRLFKKIEEAFEDNVCKETKDGKTVLHIACINNRLSICEYICSQLQLYGRIINKKTNNRGWTAAHYVAVEIKEDGTEGMLINALVSGGINLKATNCDGNTVLGVACEHRNKHLINYLLEHHPELLGIDNSKLEDAANLSDDEDIISQIQNVIRMP